MSTARPPAAALAAGLLLDLPVRRWACGNCDQTAVTREAIRAPRFHNCAGLAGITAPMVDPAQVGAVRVHAVEREDYEGSDTGQIQHDANGRPIMAVITTRDDGQDCAVLAPTAVGSARA